jgi:hypothetical protein
MNMKNILEALEREAGRLVNIVDNQFQDTTVRVMTGDVFTHDPSAHVQNCQEQPVQSITVQPAVPTRPAADARPSKDQPMRQPTLQQALNKR